MRPKPNPYRWDQINLSLFYGRTELLNEIVRGLQQGQSYAVVGGRRMGKTTLLRKVEAELLKALPASVEKGFCALPIYLDVQGLSYPLNPEAIFAAIVTSTERLLTQYGLLNPGWQSANSLFSQFPNESNRAFALALEQLMQAVTQAALHFIVLIDEIEPIVNTEWGDGFFNNWRTFLHNTPQISSNLDAVFAGAREMAAIARDIGSPLSNVLVWRELTLFSQTDTAMLVNEPTNSQLPPQFAKRVFNHTGGHPFLIQYLMHIICNKNIASAETRFRQAVKQVINEQHGLFSRWWFEHFGPAERRIYAFLAGQRRATTKREIVLLVGDTVANNALPVLTHTGVVGHTSRQEKYRAQGQVFKAWFSKHGSLPIEPGEHDAVIEAKLQKIDTKLAERYVTAWKILQVDLLNYSGATGEFRDVLTFVLHSLAPNDAVKSEPNYAPEKGKDGQPLANPTRKQRVRYLIHHHHNTPPKKAKKASKELEPALQLFDTLLTQLEKSVDNAYGRASGRTHAGASHKQAWQCLKQLDSILAQLLPD